MHLSHFSTAVLCMSAMQGMVEAADYISNKIKDEDLLVHALESDPVVIHALASVKSCLTEIVKDFSLKLNKRSISTLS